MTCVEPSLVGKGYFKRLLLNFGAERIPVWTGTKSVMCSWTDGTIVQKLLRDPSLKNYKGVVVDELHEHKIQIEDFAL